MTKEIAGSILPKRAPSLVVQATDGVAPKNVANELQNGGNLTSRATGLGGLILLIALADFLFWGFRPGATLGIFAIAVFVVAAAQYGTLKYLMKPALLMGLAILPILEHVQSLSVVILLTGAICSLAWLRVARKGGVELIVASAMKLIASIPFSGMTMVVTTFRNLRDQWLGNRSSERSRSATFLRNWSLPIGGSLVLGSLLFSANPVLEQAALQLFQLEMNIVTLLERVMFWGGMGLLIWPLLNAQEPKTATSITVPAFDHQFGLNGGSVLRALIVFNLFLGVQTTLDFSILFGNAALPDGMTYATYAHRGAYPLMVTAMLAGIFSITARPFLKDHTALKSLLILWVTQNVVLTFTAAMRLNLYVAEYGLTYLRTHALIGMALIAIGLVIVLWHVLREKSSLVLVSRLAALGFATLYLCSFVNFASIIAKDMITRAADTSNVTSADWDYLCQLGPTATKSVTRGLAANPAVIPPTNLRSCFQQHSMPSNWREMDFRTARTHVVF
jgi:hypothetical protein